MPRITQLIVQSLACKLRTSVIGVFFLALPGVSNEAGNPKTLVSLFKFEADGLSRRSFGGIKVSIYSRGEYGR